MPLMLPITIGSDTHFVARDEVDTALELIAKVKTGQRDEAHAIWTRWVAAAARSPTPERRKAIGAALDLFDEQTLAEHRIDEARRAKLYACPMHVFDMTGIERTAGAIPPRLVCVMCAQWMLTVEACAYARGFAAAGGDPNTVIEGFEAAN